MKLINPAIDMEFAGEMYKVRRANLEQVILFQKRFQELSEAKDAGIESKIAAYCIFLILSAVRPETTEDWVLKNAPGDLTMLDVIEQLGFLNRQKVDILRGTRNAPVQTGGQSST